MQGESPTLIENFIFCVVIGDSFQWRKGGGALDAIVTPSSKK